MTDPGTAGAVGRRERLRLLAEKLDLYERRRQDLEDLREEIEVLLESTRTDVRATLGAEIDGLPGRRPAAAGRRPGDTQRAILDALRAAGVPITANEIADAIAKPVSNVRNALQAMLASGTIARTGEKGAYRYAVAASQTTSDERSTPPRAAPPADAEGRPSPSAAPAPAPAAPARPSSADAPPASARETTTRPTAPRVGADALPDRHPMRRRAERATER